MSGGWGGSNRRERLPANWPALRAKQLKADGYRCTWRLPSGKRCPRPATEVDHKYEKVDDDSNLQSLCADHHARKTSIAAHRFKAAQKRKRYREPEAHPGTLS